MDLRNKVVLITGSSKGIEKETALVFAEEKAGIIITYNKDKKGAEQIFKKCKSFGTNCAILHLDITKDKSIKSAVKKIISKFKKVDFLINNAGIVNWHDFEKQSFKDIELQLRTNLVHSPLENFKYR